MASAPQITPPRRPRLSLQIKTNCSPITKSSRCYPMDPKDPTALNTLSNVYMTAIERATPVQSEPPSNAFRSSKPKLRVVTPYVATYPDTPPSANASSPPKMPEFQYPSAMTATPPLSAGTDTDTETAPAQLPERDVVVQLQTPPRQAPSGPTPYTHPRALHSILRNSPLPSTNTAPASPRRQSRRLQEKAAKRVGYHNPLTQEITTNKYTKSHIDLLVEEASPCLSPDVQMQPESLRPGSGLNLDVNVDVDVALAFTPNEIEDGGQTPGPLEDVRRRMAKLAPGSPVSSPGGIRKRKKKEKKRRWVWTIGQDDEKDDDVGGAIAALRAEASRNKANGIEDVPKLGAAMPAITVFETPTPSIESTDSGSESYDVEMSDTSSLVSDDRGLTPSDMDLDAYPQMAPRRPSEEEAPVQRDSRIPPELVMAEM